VSSRAPTYVRNIEKGKSQKKSWYQYIFLGLAPKSLRLPGVQLHGCTPYLALISSACFCNTCQGGELDSASGANTPEADAIVAERYLAMTPDGGVGLTRAIAWRMAKTYPNAWQKIGGELVIETLKSSGIGADLQTLVSTVQEMRQALQKDDADAFGKAAGKFLGVPKTEEKHERLIVNDLLKRSKEQKSDSKELSELKATLAANTPEGNATVAERFLAMTPDGGVGLMRATARRMAETYPEAWSQISTDLVNSTLKEAAIGTDLQGLIVAVTEMRTAIKANDGDAFGKAAGKLLGAPKAE
jgi:hypothetical protein